MAITRDDIINKVFSRSVLGYDDSEVDSFLDEIMVDIENCQERLAESEQENEALKMSINRINEDASRVMASRQEINRLRDENSRLQAEIENLKMRFNEVNIEEKNRLESDRQAQLILIEAKKHADEYIHKSEAAAREAVDNAELQAAQVLKSAKDSANQIARNVQEREKQIMDRAQDRARIILEQAQTRISAGLGSPRPESRAAAQANSIEKKISDFSFLIEPDVIDSTADDKKKDDTWPGWLDR